MFTNDKITEIFCICDDFCREFDVELQKKAVDQPKYRGCGKRKPEITESEMITILILFHTNTFRNFKHFYIFFVKEHLKESFPTAPSYSKFVSLMKRTGIKLAFFLRLGLMGECSGISFVDSTCIPVCHNKRIYRNKVFSGEILNFVLTKANMDDRNEMVFKEFEKNLFGKLYADKGYISQHLFQTLWNNDIHLVSGIKANMKNKLMPFWDKILLRKRSIIETINDVLKNVGQLVHSRHRSVDNFLVNMLSVLAAYCFFDKRPSINIDFEMEETQGQLCLFN